MSDSPRPRDRLLAFAWDYAIVAAYLCVMAALGMGLTFGPWGTGWQRALQVPWRMHGLAFATTVLPVTLYFALTEAGPHAASLGKRRRRLRVVTMTGAAPSLGRTLLRNGLKFLPWHLAHTAMLAIPGFPNQVEVIPPWTVATLAGVWVLVAAYVVGLAPRFDGRPLYDRMAGTRCVASG